MRRLRLGVSLYKKTGETDYTVDLSKMKHKTTRFYGPVISTLPSCIGDWVSEYEQSIALEMTGDNPYLFSCAARRSPTVVVVLTHLL